MKNHPISIKLILAATGLFLLFFSIGCLEIPKKPDFNAKVEQIGVLLIKDGYSDSLSLKTNADEPFTLRAFVEPAVYAPDLKFYWYRDTTLLGDSIVIAIDTPFTHYNLPNQVKAVDIEKNELPLKFEVLLNHPPTMALKTTPTDLDTLYGNFYTAISFSWRSNDKDKNDLLQHFIKINDTVYATGELTSIQQSGFKPGAHTFSIWVVDPLGDADTLSYKTFVLIDTVGGDR